MANETPHRLQIGTAVLNAANVQLRDDVILDEVRIESAEISLEQPAGSGEPAQIKTGEVKFRATMSELNLNRMLTANLPPEAPVRNLKVALFSGKARISGTLVKVIGIPFTIDATIKIVNGVRVIFDLTTGTLVGLGLPSAVVELIEQSVNRAVSQDLTKLPVPVYLEEVRCEPGRVTVIGKARIIWPPPPAVQNILPFSPVPLELPPSPTDSGF